MTSIRLENISPNNRFISYHIVLNREDRRLGVMSPLLEIFSIEFIEWSMIDNHLDDIALYQLYVCNKVTKRNESNVRVHQGWVITLLN